MKLQEKLDKISVTSKLIKLQNGKASDLDKFWSNFIEPNLPQKNAVIGWHKILLKYVKEEKAIFSLRTFGSKNKNEDSKVLRRGFINLTNLKFKTVFVDNFFTSYFFSMAYDGYIPKYNEFKKLMFSRSFPLGYVMTADENKYAAFQKGKDPKIQYKGYKIAHIYDAGQNFNFTKDTNTIGNFCKTYFPRGKYDDWKFVTTDKYGKYHYRKVSDIPPSDKERVHDFLVAHFLRTVHPINYFLVPKRGYISYQNASEIKNEIGEYEPLIKYVEQKIHQKYKNIYDEYLKLIAPIKKKQSKQKSIIINAEYGNNKVTNKPNTTNNALKPSAGIGKMVQVKLFSALQKNKFSSQIIKLFQTRAYSKTIFGISYPLLSQNRFDNKNRARYYKNKIEIKGVKYYVCKEWTERHRAKLEKWLKKHGTE